MHHLPTPHPETLALSEKLIKNIKQIMEEAGGMISFAEFMDLALYAPNLGYYSAGVRKLGEQGDFITAPEISPLFSKCLARQCQQILSNLEDAVILEFGAGSGIMAADILLELESLNQLPIYNLQSTIINVQCTIDKVANRYPLFSIHHSPFAFL